MTAKAVIVTKEEFERLFEERIQKCREVLTRKFKEYSSGSDVMRNFNTVGRMLGEPPYRVAFYYMMKHFGSVYDIIVGGKEASPEAWDEKIGDILNYLFLIDAMWRRSHDQG